MAADVGPFNYTATGVLGDKRETMLRNELHLRPELGRPRSRGYRNAFHEGFTFGVTNTAKQGGVAEAISGWNPTVDLPFHRSAVTKTERDFMALNRAAVEAGLTTATEHSNYRATHDLRKNVEVEGQKKTVRTRRIPASMVFGMPTRPSTPVFDLLEHKYQQRWIDSRRAEELAKKKEIIEQKKVFGEVYNTRATLLRVYQNPVEQPPLWHMPKFSKHAQPHLETFRSINARYRALEAHVDDRVGRQGLHGHGIYEPAKN